MSRLLTPDEVSLMLIVKPDTVKKWRQRGRGPTYIKVEGSVRYRLSDVQEYMRHHMKKIDDRKVAWRKGR